MREVKSGGNVGSYGEEIAASYLKKQGYRILEQNYRKRYGEIDIIAEDGEDIVFVEVKTRKSDLFGSPFEAVDTRKQHRMSRVALAYLHSRKMSDRSARFDVVAVMVRAGMSLSVEVIRNAFEVGIE